MADTNLGNTQFFSTKPEQELQVPLRQELLLES